MSETMRAAVLPSPGADLVVEHIPVPHPSAGEVMMRVAACGVCHTDLHVMKGDIPFPCPCVMGHEVSGTIVEVGAGVEGLAIGDRVASAFIMPCGTCRFCVRGRDDLCEKFFAMNRGKGVLYDGTTRLARADGTPLSMYSMAGLAEYSVVPASDAFVLPDSVDHTEAAIVGCSLFTAYGAVRHGADLRHRDTVAVYGVGGIGLNVVQLAAALGAAQVIAVDLADDKLAAAASLGATHTVNGSATDAPAAIRDLTGGEGVDLAFEAVGHPVSFEQAVMSVRDGGRMVAIGLANTGTKASIGITHIVRRGITIVGSYGARTRTDMPELLRLVGSGDVRLDRVITERVGLDDAGETYRRLDHGDIVGRAVVVMDRASV
jgi:succinate semialdehyde reductase (NADPH)